MNKEQALAVFENYEIRRTYDEKSETWFFSVVDIIAALIGQPDYQTARKYWNKLKERLKKEGCQSVTNCHQLKLPAADGKRYLTDAASPETLFRLIQSVPSPRAEPIKLWLAKVGYERIQDMSDPARSLDRARDYWKQLGYWILKACPSCHPVEKFNRGLVRRSPFGHIYPLWRRINPDKCRHSEPGR